MKEYLSTRSAICMIVLFIIGEASILMTGISAGKSIYIAIIAAYILILPMVFVYSNIMKLHPKCSFFEIIQLCFGKTIGNIIIGLYTWYSFDLASLVLVDLGNLVGTINLKRTPREVYTLPMLILGIWIIKKGLREIGKWSEVFIVVPIILATFAIIMLVPKMNINNMYPLFDEGTKNIFKGTYDFFIYPLGETVVFLTILDAVKDVNSIKKIYLKSISIGAVFLLVTYIAIILVIGADEASILFFAGYSTITRVEFGMIVQRPEVIAAIVYLLGAFIKIVVYMIAACKGISTICNSSDYKYIITPLGLLTFNLSLFEFKSTLKYSDYIFNTWVYYAFLFMVIIPITIFLVGILKVKFNDH